MNENDFVEWHSVIVLSAALLAVAGVIFLS